MPANTPRPIADRLHAEMKRIMTAPDMREKIAAVGLIPNDSPSIEEMRGYIASERVKWGALVKQLGLEASQNAAVAGDFTPHLVSLTESESRG